MLKGGVALGLTVICAPFVSPALRKFCLPYIPATNEQVKNIFLALNNCKAKGNLVDLGSGDGRIVIGTLFATTVNIYYHSNFFINIDAAKKGFTSHGVELNPWLVLFSKLNAIKQGQNTKTQFYCRDLWKFDLSKYDNVVIFGVEQMVCLLQYL